MSEMDKLEAYLKAKGYHYERLLRDTGFKFINQIIVYDNGVRDWDAICHRGSYGYEEGLLEVLGPRVVRPESADVNGYLTAKDIIDRLEGRA